MLYKFVCQEQVCGFATQEIIARSAKKKTYLCTQTGTHILEILLLVRPIPTYIEL